MVVVKYYWLSNNLYIGSDEELYRIDYRRVSERTFVREEPVRIGMNDIEKRGNNEGRQGSYKGSGKGTLSLGNIE